MRLNEKTRLRATGVGVWNNDVTVCLWESKDVATVEEGIAHLKERERLINEREVGGWPQAAFVSPGHLEVITDEGTFIPYSLLRGGIEQFHGNGADLGEAARFFADRQATSLLSDWLQWWNTWINARDASAVGDPPVEETKTFFQRG